MVLPEHIRSPDPSILLSDNYVVIDVETTNHEFGNASLKENRLLLTCWKRKGERTRYQWDDEYHIGKLVDMLERVDLIVAHNAKMELKWLARAGIDLAKVMPYCTMIGDYVLAGNRRWPLSLDQVSRRYGMGGKDPYVDKLMKAKVCPSDIPESFLLARCAKDVEQTEAIFLQQRKMLADAGLLPVMFTRCFFTPVLADIELQGLALDADRVNKEYERCSEELREVNRELASMAPDVNFNSGKQLAGLLYGTLGFKQLTDSRGNVLTTPGGAPKTDIATITSLRATNKRQRQFQDAMKRYSLLDAEMTKALSKFKECVDNGDVLFAEFNQTVTATHRLSSSGVKYNVQFQNLARKFKPLFRAKTDGHLIAEDDGAQIEFRVAGFLGQDKQAYDDIINEEDVHSYTAQVLTEAGQETDRQAAKAHTFKPLYGGQSGTKAEQAYYAAFRAKYPGIAATQEAWKQEVLRNKCLRLAHGLTFYWPDTRMSQDGYISNSTAICNYPVQNLATGEIVPIAVTYQWHKMRAARMDARIVNTVHDSAISEVRADEEGKLREIATEAFTDDVYSYLDRVYNMKFNIPLGIGHKAGEHWSEGNEIKTQKEPPYAGPK